jgi:hypothetical protein
MAIGEGVIMLADRLVENEKKDNGAKRIFKRKVFTIGNNIGLSCLCHYNTKGSVHPIGEQGAIANFCKAHTFRTPQEAAQAFSDRLCNSWCDTFKISMYVAHISGFNAGKPEMYLISNLNEAETGIGSHVLKFCGNKGLMGNGNGKWFFRQYIDMINSDAGLKLLDDYSLQDAVNFSKLLHTMGRGLRLYLDLEEKVSEDFDVLSITPNGIQRLKRQELEVI